MITEKLRDTCRRLLTEGTVDVVIGYGQPKEDGPVHPVFITKPEDADQLVFNDKCYANLAMYLTRKEIRSLGKPAVVVKGCDERAIVVLEKESQIDREKMVVIGVACDGVGEPKCESCEVHMPRYADAVIGESKGNGRPISREQRYARLSSFLESKSPDERMAWWSAEFDRCVKCYACRQVCPLCYCERCIVDKNRPTVLDTSATLKGNYAWHITRAFHLAGRCIGCDECTRVCPAGIDLRLLNLSLGRATEEHFSYRPGMDREAEPVMGSYAESDKEDFIR